MFFYVISNGVKFRSIMSILSFTENRILELPFQVYLKMDLATRSSIRSVRMFNDALGMRVRVEFRTEVGAKIARKRLGLKLNSEEYSP